MKKRILFALGLASLLAFTACGKKAEESKPAESVETSAGETTAGGTKADNTDLKIITVGASPTPHAEILEAAAPVLKEAGYELKIVQYTDYIQPNVALSTGELDANYFQHFPYLEAYNEENKTKLVSAGAIHYEPFGIYAGKTASLDALADGAKVAVPNDTTNEARALLLLEANGLIKLNPNAGLNATKQDITENTKNLDIVEVEAAQVPRSLQDVDIAVINGNYAIDAGLKVSDALATEDSKSIAATTYANVIAVREGDEKSDATLALINALESDAVKKFIEDKYSGAVVPMF